MSDPDSTATGGLKFVNRAMSSTRGNEIEKRYCLSLPVP